MTAGFGDDLRVELWADRHPQDRYLLLSVRVRNDRSDHRLRLHVTLDEPGIGSVAMAPFEVVERPLVTEGGTETPSQTWPARGAVSSGGVSVFHPAVFEYEVLGDRPELAVTLLRSVGTISRAELATRSWAAGPDVPTPEAQLVGREYTVRLAVARGIRPEDLPAEWERHHLHVFAIRAPGGGDLPDRGSLLEVEGCELSAVRRLDQGTIEVRIWNPTSERRTARVADQEIGLGPARIETISLPAAIRR
jgi:alpha-mannosidase